MTIYSMTDRLSPSRFSSFTVIGQMLTIVRSTFFRDFLDDYKSTDYHIKMFRFLKSTDNFTFSPEEIFFTLEFSHYVCSIRSSSFSQRV